MNNKVDTYIKGNIKIGDKIYKIASKELSAETKLSYKDENKKIMLYANMYVHKDKPIKLTVSTIDSSNKLFNNISVTKQSDVIPVEASSRPMDFERISSQLNKTKDTIFSFKNINVDLEENTFVPSISSLNDLRRNCLEEIMTIANSRLIRNSNSIKLEKVSSKGKKHKNRTVTVLLNILNEDFDYSKLENIDNVYIPLKYFSNKKYESTILSLSNSFNVYIYLPAVIRANYKNILSNLVEKSIANYNIKGFVISNLSSFMLINKLPANGNFEYIANYTLNSYNSYTEKELTNLGISKITISPELSSNDIDNLCSKSDFSRELIVYGRTPLMSSNYCLLGHSNKCYPNCGTRCLDNKQYYLKDRLGFKFRIIPDNVQTVTTIFNSKITSIDGSVFNVNSYRIDILDEDIEQINSIVSTVLAGNRLEGKEYTNGNLNREI